MDAEGAGDGTDRPVLGVRRRTLMMPMPRTPDVPSRCAAPAAGAQVAGAAL
jgi:hypothetical protein